MAEAEFEPDFESKIRAKLQNYGNNLISRTDNRIQENILDSGRIDTGLMVRSTYHEEIGELSWRAGVRGEHYFELQERGVMPFEVEHTNEDGTISTWTNRGFEGAHFVEDAKLALEAGEISGLD